jgi:dTDP-4-dehydrorhamnose reductase
MLGRDVVEAFHAKAIECTPLNSSECDITDSLELARAIPVCDWVINCAAYTRVDDAESDSEQARRLNRDGAGNIAEMCMRREISLLHVSTDYVFDGSKDGAYVESDPINPVNVYGQTKFEGEQAIRETGCKAIVVRTQALFGTHGRNFVKTTAERLAQTDEPLKVVTDQVMSPTYTGHLAQAIIRLLECGKQGIVHVAASGTCSWFDLACAIADRVKPGHSTEAVTSDSYKTPARRPPNAALDTGRFERWTGWTMPTWQEGLDGFLSKAELAAANRSSPAHGADSAE